MHPNFSKTIFLYKLRYGSLKMITIRDCVLTQKFILMPNYLIVSLKKIYHKCIFMSSKQQRKFKELGGSCCCWIFAVSLQSFFSQTGCLFKSSYLVTNWFRQKRWQTNNVDTLRFCSLELRWTSRQARHSCFHPLLRCWQINSCQGYPPFACH